MLNNVPQGSPIVNNPFELSDNKPKGETVEQAGIDVDDLVKRIDKKIAELEAEEKKKTADSAVNGDE